MAGSLVINKLKEFGKKWCILFAAVFVCRDFGINNIPALSYSDPHHRFLALFLPRSLQSSCYTKPLFVIPCSLADTAVSK
jgi:hypothetical protein